MSGCILSLFRHTEIAAFLASLCKVVGILEHKVIPPNVNLHRLNPAIHWSEYNMQAPVAPTPLNLPAQSNKALISISSFGIGGANGHCVIEEPPARPIITRSLIHGPVLLAIGALSPRAITSLCTSYDVLLREYPEEAASLSHCLGRRSRQMSWRCFAVVDPENTSKTDFTPPLLVPRAKPVFGFVFSGQGPQHFDSELSVNISTLILIGSY